MELFQFHLKKDQLKIPYLQQLPVLSSFCRDCHPSHPPMAYRILIVMTSKFR